MPAKLDTETITQPTKADLSTINPFEFNWACRKLGIRPVEHRFEEYHLSTKSGPNDQAILSSLYETTLLPDSLKESLTMLAGEELAQRLDGVARNQKDFAFIDWFYET